MMNTRLEFCCPSCGKWVKVSADQFWSQLGKRGTGHKKTYTPEELQRRRLRLEQARELRWTKKPLEHDKRRTVGAKHREDRQLERQGQSPALPVATAPEVPVVKVGRNEPCPCGSGLKFKRCHGKAL